MATPFVGELRLVGFNFAPLGWAMCNGQILAISENVALFSLLGTMYGGDGVRTFALPNLQGRVPIHTGSLTGGSFYTQGEVLGAESVTLLTTQIPAHSHNVNCDSGKGNKPAPTGNFPAADAAGVTAEYAAATNAQMNPGMIAATGGSQPHENRQPSLVLNWIISLEGIFPSRS